MTRMRSLTALASIVLFSGCVSPPPVELASRPMLGKLQAQRLLKERLRATLPQSWDSHGFIFKDVQFLSNGVKATCTATAKAPGKTKYVFYPYEKDTYGHVTTESGGYGVDIKNEDHEFSGWACVWIWASRKEAVDFVHALQSLRDEALSAAVAGGGDSLTAFHAKAEQYRKLATTTTFPEEARKHRIQAEGAFEDKRFEDAADLYGKALEAAPWWPEGYFNRALLLGELRQFGEAITEMKKFLLLKPGGADARAAQDKIYLWEGKSRN